MPSATRASVGGGGGVRGDEVDGGLARAPGAEGVAERELELVVVGQRAAAQLQALRRHGRLLVLRSDAPKTARSSAGLGGPLGRHVERDAEVEPRLRLGAALHGGEAVLEQPQRGAEGVGRLLELLLQPRAELLVKNSLLGRRLRRTESSLASSWRPASIARCRLVVREAVARPQLHRRPERADRLRRAHRRVVRRAPPVVLVARPHFDHTVGCSSASAAAVSRSRAPRARRRRRADPSRRRSTTRYCALKASAAGQRRAATSAMNDPSARCSSTGQTAGAAEAASGKKRSLLSVL